MSDTSPRLELPYLLPSQAQKHVTHNEALKRLDVLVQLSVLALDAETPPAVPGTGDVHGLGPAPTGVWAGHAGALAFWDGVAWSFLAPQAGWRAWDQSLGGFCVHDGTGWTPVAVGTQMLDGVGIGTTSDATNRLAVTGDATLLSHAGAGHQLKLNKAGTGDTASVLFQSGWTGHAEIGLAGSDDFALKVSADGNAWVQALRVTPGAMQVDVPITGSAIQTDAVDNASGKILTAGAGGLLGAAPAGDDFDAPVLGSHQNSGQLTETEAAAAGLPAVGGAGSQNRWWQVQTFGTSTRMVQIATEVYGTGAAENGDAGQGGRTYIRTRHDATWDDWRLIYTQATVRGTVGQSGGVPTGALIERGSNANGEYVRFADGTQICWHKRTETIPTMGNAGTGFTVDLPNWDFPMPFESADSMSAVGSTNSGGTICALNPNTTKITPRIQTFSDATGNTKLNCFQAVGRWF